MKYMDIEQTKAAQDLCAELPLIVYRLFQCGMIETAHAMDAAVKRSGYELAERAAWRNPAVIRGAEIDATPHPERQEGGDRAQPSATAGEEKS